MSTDGTTTAPGTGAYAEVNGINLYVETHGTGRPLILLHGGLGSGEMFGPVLSAFTAGDPGFLGGPPGHRGTPPIHPPPGIPPLGARNRAPLRHPRPGPPRPQPESP